MNSKITREDMVKLLDPKKARRFVYEQAKINLKISKESLVKSERAIREYHRLMEDSKIPKWIREFVRWISRADKHINTLLDGRDKIINDIVWLEKTIKEYKDG